MARVEDRPALAHEDVAWYDVLIWRFLLSARVCVERGGVGTAETGHTPENFLTPSRFPGEPPWLETVPPARFVAVRTDPSPVAENRGLSVAVRGEQ